MSTRFTHRKDDVPRRGRLPASARLGEGEASKAPASPRRSPLAFFVLVFGLSVPLWGAGVLTQVRLLPGLPVSALAVVCPTIAASILVHRERGIAGVVALLGRSFDHRRISRKVWYAPALLLMPGLAVVAYGVMRWMGTPMPAPRFPVLTAFGLLVVSFVGALGEELGWSGYVLDPLQARWSALQAAVILGCVGAAWHLVALVQADRSPGWIAWWCLYSVAGRVLLTWLYDNAGKSVFAVALCHATSNLAWQLFPDRSSHWDPRVAGLVLAGAAAVVTLVWGPGTLARTRATAALAAIATAAGIARAGEATAGPARDNAWFVLPIVFYLPETSVGGGVTGALHLIRPGRKTSSLQPSVVYTLERQSYAEVLFQFFDSERTAFAGAARAAHFPYQFYGIGPLAPRDARVGFTTRYAEVLAAREWQVSRDLRAGPKLHARAEELVEMEASGQLAPGAASSADHRAVGLGATATFDGRDDLFWPTRGTYVEVWALAYAADASRTFARSALVVRRFLPLGGGQTVGLDARVEAAGGDVPFTLLPRVGGALGLRGYYDGRWRDRFLWSTQAEWRFPIAWRLRGTVFAGVGGVAPSLARLDDTHPRPAGGLGIRVRVTSTGLNVRGDVAFGEEGPATYLTIGEAF